MYSPLLAAAARFLLAPIDKRSGPTWQYDSRGSAALAVASDASALALESSTTMTSSLSLG
eukprot:4688428-Lingulodinium_polyedra.AAC.1